MNSALTPGDIAMFAANKARECRHRAEEHRTKADRLYEIIEGKRNTQWYKDNAEVGAILLAELEQVARQAAEMANYCDEAAGFFEDYCMNQGFGVK